MPTVFATTCLKHGCPNSILLKKKILRLGIILYGFRLTFQDVVNVGMAESPSTRS